MIDPERWYEYQRNYQKYGFDMKPKPEPEPAPTKRTRQRKTVKVPFPLASGKKIAVFWCCGYRGDHDHADHRYSVCSQYPV